MDDDTKLEILKNFTAKVDEMFSGDEEEKAAAMEMLTELAEDE